VARSTTRARPSTTRSARSSGRSRAGTARSSPEASFLAEEGRILGASLVTLVESRPFLAYLVAHPDVQRRGLGASLVAATGNALLSAGRRELALIVTEANEPPVALYRKLGFEQVERLPEPPATS
jgi:ribosomal protein S18 acetylase RimI-like enzyme